MTVEKRIVVYGTTWCGDCRRARAYLESKEIPYDYIDIGADAQAAAFVMKVNRGFRSVPTIVFQDGSILVEPSTRELAQKIAGLASMPILLYRRHVCPGCVRMEELRRSCGECERLARVLAALEVPFRVLNIDQDPDAERSAQLLVRPDRGLPAVVFPDGTTLVQPTVAEVAAKLGV